MSKILPFGTFIFGCALGVFGSYRYFEKKFECISEEEIESVKQAFKRTYIDKVANDADKEVIISVASEEQKEVISDDFEKRNNKEIKEAKKIVEKAGYSKYTNIMMPSEDAIEYPVGEVERSEPYVIDPNEFDMEDYTVISLTYYADGVLANEEDEEIIDVDEMIGAGSLTHFGEYEDDSVYVRDDIKRIDYEILLDERTYTQVVESKPRRVSLEE